MSFFLFFFFFIVIKCQVKKESLMNNNNNRNLQSGEFTNIKLVINENCYQRSAPNNIDLPLLSQGIKKAQNAIEKLVKIKRTSEKISINYNNDIHPDHPDFICYSDGDLALLNTEITADLYIIIKLEASSIKRFAKPSIIKCDDNGRPIIGTILYNTDYLQNLEDDDLLEAISVIFLHEFTHILGFTKEILQKKFLILTRKDVKNRMNDINQNKSYVNGTTVIKRAKAYFNYPELDGVELEDANENNENMTHWSQRILLGDYMISEIYYSEQAISEITLALLEDLKWYTVNYYTGGLMKFGKHKGKNFFIKDCIEEKKKPRF